MDLLAILLTFLIKASVIYAFTMGVSSYTAELEDELDRILQKDTAEKLLGGDR